MNKTAQKLIQEKTGSINEILNRIDLPSDKKEKLQKIMHDGITLRASLEAIKDDIEQDAYNDFLEQLQQIVCGSYFFLSPKERDEEQEDNDNAILKDIQKLITC